jgi:Calpain family cysteine protease
MMLGDCYYLEGLAELARTATDMKDIFLLSSYDPAVGIFAAQVYIRGIPKQITVDDYFGFYKNWGIMIFAQLDSRDNSIWGAVLEKMWAKAMGSYDKIVGGNPFEPYDFLLGAPSMVYWMTDLTSSGANYVTGANSAWGIITDSIDAGY